MAVKAFSNEWAKAFKDEVNKSSVYKTAGKGWKWTVGLVVEAEPEKHFPEAKGIVMDLFDGEARDIEVGSAADAQKCDFVITAPYTRWKEVATNQLDATKGMLQGKLKQGASPPPNSTSTAAPRSCTRTMSRARSRPCLGA